MSSRPRSAAQARSPGRPPGATAEATRADILDAALEAFAEAGFEAMSVRELTRRLGVSHNLVHHHFGTKQDLWRAAIDHGVGATVAELLALVGENVGSSEPKQILRQGMETAMDLLRSRPALARIVTDESARAGARLDYLYDKYLGPLIELLGRFLAESRVHGIRSIDTGAAILFVLSAASAPAAHGALAEKLGIRGTAPGPYTDGLIDLVLDGLMAPEPVGMPGA